MIGLKASEEKNGEEIDIWRCGALKNLMNLVSAACGKRRKE